MRISAKSFKPLVIIAAICTIFVFWSFCRVSAAEEEIPIKNLGEATVYAKDGTELTTSMFEIEGERAFCMEFFKMSPFTKSLATGKWFKDEQLQKALYYGYGGPGQWKGFEGKSEQECQLLMTALLSDLKPQDYDGGDSTDISRKQKLYKYLDEFGYSELKKFVLAQELTEYEAHFSKSQLKAFYSEESGTERTEVVKLEGSSNTEVEIEIPEGYELYLSKEGSSSVFDKVTAFDSVTTGDETASKRKITLHTGDSFYLCSSGEISAGTKLEFKGRYKAMHPYVYVTASKNFQDLVRIRELEKEINLELEWPQYVVFGLIKLDSETEEKLEGVKFELRAAEDIKSWLGEGLRYKKGDLVAELITDENGTATTVKLPPGKYMLTETETLEGYILDEEAKLFELRPEDGNKEFYYNAVLYNSKEEQPPDEPKPEPDKPVPPTPTPPVTPPVVPVDTGDSTDFKAVGELLLAGACLLMLTLMRSCDKL